MSLSKVITLIILFTVSACQHKKVDDSNVKAYDLSHLLKQFTLEKTTIDDIKKTYHIIAENPSKFGNSKFLFVAFYSHVIPIPYILTISNEGILREVRIYKDINQWESIASALKVNFTSMKPNYKYLKTFKASDDIIIELSKHANKKFLVIQICSAKYRQELIELYKVEALKGEKLYQNILNNIKVTY